MRIRLGAYPEVEHFKGTSVGCSLALLANVRLGWKGLPGTNALAYFASSSATEKKVFVTLEPGANVIKLFPSLLTTRPNKPECLYLAIAFQTSLTFDGNTRSLTKKEASERFSYWVGSGLAFKF